MTQHSGHYIGEELDVFFHARNWKRYWSSRIHRWIVGDALEVGAGIGANTADLQTPAVRSWHCLEPDPRLTERLREAVAGTPSCEVSCGITASLSGESWDTILYIDVLEHIEDDRGELARAARLLRPGGHIIVLSPAHQFLFSPFDAAIGHYRRYNKTTLRACTPPGCRLEAMFYLDSLGMVASLANRAMLRQAQPSLDQILFWDRRIVPLSRFIDPLLGYRLGKTIIGVWRRADRRDETVAG